MINDEIAAVVSNFMDPNRPPTHDDLDRAFRRFGLASADPAPRGQSSTGPLGKKKRVKEVLGFAIDSNPASGEELVKLLISATKAHGGFRPEAEGYVGASVVRAAQAAFAAVGFVFTADGDLMPAQLETLEGAELTDALTVLTRRAQLGTLDASLLVGVAKDLTELVARQALLETRGDYDRRQPFAGTLFFAFEALGLEPLRPDQMPKLDPDPMRAMQQALYLLALTVNTLRNAEGYGHGHPEGSAISDSDGTIAIQASGVVSRLLLETLKEVRR